MTLKAILFDSDGVLLDTEETFYQASRRAFEKRSIPLSREEWGRRYLGLAERSSDIARSLGIPENELGEFIRERDADFWSEIDREVRVFEGVRENVELLSKTYRLAIVTGADKRHFERVQRTTGLRSFFERAFTVDEYGESKPSPKGYLLALKEMGLTARECIAVEDSPRGAQAAIAAGLRCVVIPTPLTALDLCPKGCRIADRFCDLPMIIRPLSHSVPSPLSPLPFTGEGK